MTIASISKLPTELDLLSDDYAKEKSALVLSNLLGARNVHVDLLNLIQQISAGLPQLKNDLPSRENEFLQNTVKASFVVLHRSAALKQVGEVFVTGHTIFLHEDAFVAKINHTAEIREDIDQAVAWLKEGALRCFEEALRQAGLPIEFHTSAELKNAWPFIEQERARYALLNSNTSGVSEDFLNTFVPLNTQEADFFRYMSAVQKSDDILALEWEKMREIPFQDIDLTKPSFGYANQSWARFFKLLPEKSNSF